MRGRVVQLNTSPGGLPKKPILHAVVNELGIIGDDHAHPKYHGGPEKALLLIDVGSLDEIKAAGHPVYPGAMGENLTTEGLDRRQMRLGQRYRVGSVVVELTKMRVPCTQLDVYGPDIKKVVFDERVKAGDFTSPRWGLAGFYARIVQSGEIAPGDEIVLMEEAAAAAD